MNIFFFFFAIECLKLIKIGSVVCFYPITGGIYAEYAYVGPPFKKNTMLLSTCIVDRKCLKYPYNKEKNILKK